MKTRKKLFITSSVATLFLALCTAGAQTSEGAYSGFAPYSIFAIGDLANQGTAYNRTMGGVGIASRNNRYINPLNPAAVTARDSLAFMSDFSLYENNVVFRQNDIKSGANLFNVNDFIISFPVYRSLSVMAGIKPFSTTGYSTSSEYYMDGMMIVDSHSGQGSLYQLFAAAGFNPFKNLALGVEITKYFGDIEKKYSHLSDNENVLDASGNSTLQLNAASFKFGFQYSFDIGNKSSVCAGATYRMKTDLNGFVNNSLTNGNLSLTDVRDTLGKNSGIGIADEAGFGISLNVKDKFRIEADYIRSDWRGCGFENADGFRVSSDGGQIFRTSVSESFRAGMEYVPNISDIRYYHKRMAYRAGVYYTKEYYTANGNGISNRGITLGATLPVFRWYNGITIGAELGRRGTLNDNGIRETYIGFNVGLNLFDIWFQQPKYD